MRNIKINEAETIFENFWDSGESYPENYKYSCLSQYTVKVDEGISGGVEPTWMSVKVYMGTNKGKKAVISMERDCELDITGYDVFRLYASVSKNIKIRIKCCIDGIETEVINDCGCDTTKEYNGKISGNMISHIYMEFENMSEDASEGNLMWLGLSNSVKEAEMLAQKSPYDDSWEGCFSDEPEIKPQYGIYFNESELEELREKLSKPPFADSMELLRKEAKEAMKIIPENEIGTFAHKNFKRFIRERDDGKVVLSEEMPKLAFVGIIDNNIEMLKMACRMALSVAHCQYFCESIIGVFPGATWHHRSFTEEDICKALVKVLEWAGGLLTWHGKNIIYDAIIMKGLPRIDADIKTMDYMWKMNQGTAFVSSLVIILIALEKLYPRYSVRIDEAEKDLITMWNMYVFEDGGSAEGPQYWSFTASQMIEALYLIARYRGKSIEDYIPESIKRSSVYALAQLSDAGDFYVPVNDAHVNLNYGGNVLSFLAQINVGDIWKVKNNNSLNKKRTGTDRLIELLIFAKELDVSGDVEVPEFISLPYTGHTTLRRKTEDLGVVGLHAISGAITFGHAHSDKGSFVLEAGGKSLLIDRGVCGYDNPYVTVIGNSEMHNMIAAIKNNEYITQEKNNPELCGKVLKSEYNNGVFEYVNDVTELWNGIFEKNIRHITSVSPYQYIIEDNIKLKDADMAVFILNTYGEITQEQDKFIITDGDIRLVVSTQNWTPCETEFGRYGTDGNGRGVSRLCLMTSSKNEEKLITSVELLR